MFAMFISIIDYRIYKNTKFLGLVFLVLIAATISVKFLGRDAKGAVRWIQIGRITLQPSEFVKVGMIVIIAGFFSELEKLNKLKDPIWSVVVPLIIGGIVSGIIFFMQNHLSAAVLVMTTLLIQMFIAGINFKALVASMIAGSITVYFAVNSIFKKASGGFRQARIEVWRDPFKYFKTTGWQTSQGLLALASGGLFGVGLRK